MSERAFNRMRARKRKYRVSKHMTVYTGIMQVPAYFQANDLYAERCNRWLALFPLSRVYCICIKLNLIRSPGKIGNLLSDFNEKKKISFTSHLNYG